MTDKLAFSLVSPAKELFSGEVDHVIAPGAEGQFGVLPKHAPFMSTLKNGVVRVLKEGELEQRVFVRGGFADVTPAGLTILAEEAIDLAETDPADVEAKLEAARLELLKAPEGDPHHGAIAERVAYLDALKTAITA